jgi:signal transduction histidine kinase
MLTGREKPALPTPPPALDPRAALEWELDPERGRRNLAGGVVVFRIGSLLWMIAFNLASGGFAQPLLAYLSFIAAGAWTGWLSAHRDDQGRNWVLGLDLALSTYLVLVAAYVVAPGGVTSPARLFFATAYPVSTPLMWGMSRGVKGGLGSAFVLSVAIALTRPLNHVAYQHLSSFVGVANGAAYYFMAGGTMGAIAGALDSSARSVSAAVDKVIQEQQHVLEEQRVAAQERERAARIAVRQDLRRRIHDTVLNVLGAVNRDLRELVARHQDAELGSYSRQLARAEDDLRYLINQEDEETPRGLVSLEDWLHATKAKVMEIEVTLSRVARIYIPIAAADELCAAVYQALRNVADHAETDRAWIFADVEDGQLLVSVRDAGKGFEYDEHRLRDTRKVGMLESMKGRIQSLGGRMKVTTAPGLGTTVEFHVPMQADWVSR